MFKVRFENSGGEVDIEAVETEQEAAAAAIKMIQAAGELYDGDKITVVYVGLGG